MEGGIFALALRRREGFAEQEGASAASPERNPGSGMLLALGPCFPGGGIGSISAPVPMPPSLPAWLRLNSRLLPSRIVLISDFLVSFLFFWLPVAELARR